MNAESAARGINARTLADVLADIERQHAEQAKREKELLGLMLDQRRALKRADATLAEAIRLCETLLTAKETP